MGFTTLIMAIVLYGFIAFSFFRKKDYPMTLVFICYAVSNIGFLLAFLKTGK